MARRILLGCYEIPGWGGAATTHYRLFERMQQDGWDVAYVNLVSEKDAAFFRPLFGAEGENPRSLANVHTCIVAPPGQAPGLGDLIADFAPDATLACGFVAAQLIKRAAPDLPMAFLTAGARDVQTLVESGAVRDFVGFEHGVARGIDYGSLPSREREAVRLCDLIFVHSPIVRFAFEHLFPDSVGKTYANTISVADLIYSEAEAFAEHRRSFAERDIDLVFIASSWRRPLKNYGLVREIAHAAPGLQVHVVGEVEEPIPRATHHGVLTRREDVYALLGRTKVVVCPSLLDAAPGILFEGSAMGCNVVASRNCGNWQICHPKLLADRCARVAFLNAITFGAAGPRSDNRPQFRGGYADLTETIRAF